MIGIIIITHGNLALELKSAMEYILGIQKNIEIISIKPDDDLEIKKADLASVPHIYSPLEFYVPLLNNYKKKSLDILEEFKKYLNKFNIKFEEGDWQSFD